MVTVWVCTGTAIHHGKDPISHSRKYGGKITAGTGVFPREALDFFYAPCLRCLCGIVDSLPPLPFPLQVYWSFWGVLFSTLLTWVFAVAAAADDAWIDSIWFEGFEFSNECQFQTGTFETSCDICECKNSIEPPYLSGLSHR